MVSPAYAKQIVEDAKVSTINATASDPADELRAKVGDISGVRVLANQVLLAVYTRPKRTKSGIFLTDNTLKEDDWQGKVMLVLAMGPQAFVDDDKVTFKDKPKVGDWVVIRPADGWVMQPSGQYDGERRPLWRLAHDVDIKLVIPSPDLID